VPDKTTALWGATAICDTKLRMDHAVEETVVSMCNENGKAFRYWLSGVTLWFAVALAEIEAFRVIRVYWCVNY